MSGSSKPAKYVRLTSDVSMDAVMILLKDYWRLCEPEWPQLVLSVTGGAKNFHLDARRKQVFSDGLLQVRERDTRTHGQGTLMPFTYSSKYRAQLLCVSTMYVIYQLT